MPLLRLMGSRVDAEKLHEAGSLYAEAAREEGMAEEAEAFEASLLAVAQGVRHPRVMEVLAAEAAAAAAAAGA